TQDNVTSNTITIPLDTSSAIAKNETQSTSKSSQSTTSKSSTQSSTKPNSTTNNQNNTNPTLNQGQTTPNNQTPTQNTTPTTPSESTTSTTPSLDSTLSTPTITPDPEPSISDVVTPSEDTTPVVDTPSVEEETPNVEETPAPQPDPTPTPEQQDPTPSVEDDPASTVQDTSMSVDQVYEDQSVLIANKTPITVDGILPEALVSNGSGKEEQVLWNEDLKEYIVLEGFTIPFGGCNAQVSGTLSRNAQGQLVLNMTYISTDDVPKTGGTGYHDVTSSTKSTADDASASAIDRNNPTPHPEPGTGQ
ncbi:MAG: hypothetical protein K2H85_08640, partial [Allobaculum sp.]|nr:hypothetical protein [Allobaculum sp.]